MENQLLINLVFSLVEDSDLEPIQPKLEDLISFILYNQIEGTFSFKDIEIIAAPLFCLGVNAVHLILKKKVKIIL